MTIPIRREDTHEEAEVLLPWYATGQLDLPDHERVEAHLSSCASCRRQLKTERRLIEQFRSLTPEIDSGWARLRAQVEAGRFDPSKRGRIFADIWGLLSRPAVATLAAAHLAFVVIAGAILLTISRPDAAYRTLGASDAPDTANVIVIFRPGATEENMRHALRGSGASLVGGPTAADGYLLHVPADQRSTALTKLQSDDDVQMAEPIDRVGQ